MTPPVQPESEIQRLEGKIDAFFHDIALRLGIIHDAVKAPDAPSLPAVPVPMTPAQINAVTPIPLDPKAAVHMTQDAVQNLGYVSYLNGLSVADRNAWMHDFLIEASTNIPQGQNAGALVLDPTTGSAVQIEDTAQSNLVQLHNLGAEINTDSVAH